MRFVLSRLRGVNIAVDLYQEYGILFCHARKAGGILRGICSGFVCFCSATTASGFRAEFAQVYI